MSYTSLESSVPFEGVEKRLVVQFAPHTVALSSTIFDENVAASGMKDSRGMSKPIPSPLHMTRQQWQSVLDHAHCEIVSYKALGSQKVYLLSESSLLVWDTGFLLKTCGRTTPFLALSAFLANCCGSDAHAFYRVGVNWMTYTRLDFLHPKYQVYPHQNIDQEIEYASQHFAFRKDLAHQSLTAGPQTAHAILYGNPTSNSCSRPYEMEEALMLGIHEDCCRNFTNYNNAAEREEKGDLQLPPSVMVESLKHFSSHQLDQFWFSPCGYSSNALMQTDGNGPPSELYFSCHASPEPHTSYASLEVGRKGGSVSAFSDLSAFKLNDCIPAFTPKYVQALGVKVMDSKSLESCIGVAAADKSLSSGFKQIEAQQFCTTIGGIMFIVEHIAFKRDASVDESELPQTTCKLSNSRSLSSNSIEASTSVGEDDPFRDESLDRSVTPATFH